MNAAAIVYTSQTGFTARYAALLAERTGLPCRHSTFPPTPSTTL